MNERVRKGKCMCQMFSGNKHDLVYTNLFNLTDRYLRLPLTGNPT